MSIKKMRQTIGGWKSQFAGTVRSVHASWIAKSKDYVPTFQIIGALATALALLVTSRTLLANLDNLEHTKLNAAQQSCREAESVLDEISVIISPSFPRLLCKPPVVEEPPPWARIGDLILRADSMITNCGAVDGTPASELRGRLLIIKSLKARADSNGSEGGSEYEEYRESAAAEIGGKNPLVVVRLLEDQLLRLADLASQFEDPCLPEWKEANDTANRIFEDPTWQHDVDPAGLRGCLWQLRAEQAYWQAGFCGEDEIARLLQSITSFERSAELAQREEMLYPAIAEVLRAGPTSVLGEESEIELVMSWLNDDSQRWATKEIDHGHLIETRNSLLLDRPQKYKEQRDSLAKAVEKGRNSTGYLEELYLADVLIYGGGRQAVPPLLMGAVQENDGHNSDFRYHVLLAKALCFDGKFSESLNSFDIASALETEELAQRWGSAKVLRPMCAFAASQGSLDELHSISKESSLEEIAAEACAIREVAPALTKVLHEHGDDFWFNKFDQTFCKGWSGP
jgi:hypothetical protein